MSVMQHEAFSLDSFQDRLLWFDDFEGDQLKDEWRVGGGAITGVVDQQTGGVLRLNSPGGFARYFDWNYIRSLHVNKKVSMEIRAKLDSTTNFLVRINLEFNGNNWLLFEFDTAVDGNWHIICEDGGVPTNNDSGIVADASYHIFRIECHTHGGNHVHFYIDNIETANSPITTNVPDDVGDYLQPSFRVDSLDANTRYMDIDYVVVRQDI